MDKDKTYKNVPEFCYSATKKIAEKGYNLVPGRYIEFEDRDETLDFDTTMKNLQSELADLLNQEKKTCLAQCVQEFGLRD